MPLGAMGSTILLQNISKRMFLGKAHLQLHTALRTAEAAIDVMLEENMLENATKLGK